ncbi:MAG: hypothetical protein SPH94_08525 [Fusobacterium necrophorum]|uniref:hypothetical protein n=1 Tax=Fusobacterium necrophorum TaxID=859 RepID=UPI0010124EC2|nr:hypothetical protein [Fusobacterium necrophorum]MDY2573599.1 hypothetical protein [Fusobacterium necrophorum]MDY6173214.1 hypothetical protein [Fusobacterium necrophorum]RXZ26623.1 hypothetical protein EPT55_08610 [Fusobacterium necrophorum]
MEYKNTEKPTTEFEVAKLELQEQEVDSSLKNIEKKEDKLEIMEEKKEKDILDFEEEEEEESNIIVLKQPIKEYAEIVFDFDKNISGRILNNIEKEFRTKNKKNRDLIKELDSDYLAMVAAVASGVPYSIIMSLGGKDFTRVTTYVRNFLLVD